MTKLKQDLDFNELAIGQMEFNLNRKTTTSPPQRAKEAATMDPYVNRLVNLDESKTIALFLLNLDLFSLLIPSAFGYLGAGVRGASPL